MTPTERDYSEIARYLGYQKVAVPDEQVSTLIKAAADEMLDVIQPQSVCEKFDLTVEYDEKKDLLSPEEDKTINQFFE